MCQDTLFKVCRRYTSRPSNSIYGFLKFCIGSKKYDFAEFKAHLIHRKQAVTRKTGNDLLTGKRRKLSENAGKHLKYIKIWVAEVEGCNLYVNMGFMEVMSDIEVPICQKKSAKCTIESQFSAY